MQDFSEYLVGSKLLKEEADWARTKHYEKYAEAVLAGALMFDLGIDFDLLELGCGSGWVPSALPISIGYTGIDKHFGLLKLAAGKNHITRLFYQADIRHVEKRLGLRFSVDMVCSFAVLKHFSLHEWKDVFRGMLRLGKYGVFSIQTTDKEAYDDGTEYHHVWVPIKTVDECVKTEGKVIKKIENLNESGFDTFFYIGGKDE
jgi:SAM-dependent methyltransferase